MLNPRIDVSRDLEGEPVVLACFDLGDEDIAACAHAVAAASSERFRLNDLSVDDVLELRELTALTDELRDPSPERGVRTIALRPARLSALRASIASFVETRDEAEWIRDEDREPLARVRALLPGLEDLGAEALQAALSPSSRLSAD